MLKRANRTELQAIGAVTAIYLLTGIYLGLYWFTSPHSHYLKIPLVFLIAVLFPKIEVDKKFRIILLSISLMAAVFIVWRSLPYVLLDSQNFSTSNALLLVGIPAAAGIASMLSFKHIRFSVIPLGLLKPSYIGFQQEYGIDIITSADFIPIIEFFFCVYFTQFLIPLLKKPTLSFRHHTLKNPLFQEEGKQETFIVLTFALLTIMHLTSYLFSGQGKLKLIGLSFWTLNNMFNNNPMSGILHGTVPLFLVFPMALYFLHALYGLSPVIGNLFVISQQLLAPLAVLSRRTLLFFLAVFDMFHMLVYLFTGIFFWKWIVLNSVLFYIVYRHIKKIPAGWPSLLAIPLLVFISLKLMHPQKLAWLDTNYSLAFSVKAVLANGKTVSVPSNHFLAFSFDFSGPWMVKRYRTYAKDYPAFIWGVVTRKRDYDLAKARCGKTPEESTLHTLGDRPPLEFNDKLEQFTVRHHKLISQYGNNAFLVDIFPHHVWSFPGYFPEYYKTNLNDIVAYIFEFNEVCLYPNGDKFPTVVSGAKAAKRIDVR